MNASAVSQNFNVRECNEKDYNFVYNLTKRNMKVFVDRYWGGWNARTFRENYRPDRIKILQYGSRRIGLYEVDWKKRYCFLNSVQLVDKYKGKGIGTSLIDRIEDEAREKGYRSIKLVVFKENRAKNLYLRSGYSTTGNDDHTLTLEKEL